MLLDFLFLFLVSKNTLKQLEDLDGATKNISSGAQSIENALETVRANITQAFTQCVSDPCKAIAATFPVDQLSLGGNFSSVCLVFNFFFNIFHFLA